MNPFQNGADLRGKLNKETLDVAKGAYDLPTAVPLTPEPTTGDNNSIRTLMGGGIRSYPNRTPGFACGKDAYRAGRDRIDNAHGEVHGPGTPTSDQVPAMLSNKESVLNAGATEHVKDVFGDNIIKKWNVEHKPAGAQTKVRGGILRMAGGTQWEDVSSLYDQLQRARSTTNAPQTHGFGPSESPTFEPTPPRMVDAPGLKPGYEPVSKLALEQPKTDFQMKAFEPPKTPGTDIVPAGDRVVRKGEGILSRRTGPGTDFTLGETSSPAARQTRALVPAGEKVVRPNFTMGPNTNPGGTMQANRALVPVQSTVEAAPAEGPFVGPKTPYGSKEAQAFKTAQQAQDAAFANAGRGGIFKKGSFEDFALNPKTPSLGGANAGFTTLALGEEALNTPKVQEGLEQARQGLENRFANTNKSARSSFRNADGSLPPLPGQNTFASDDNSPIDAALGKAADIYANAVAAKAVRQPPKPDTAQAVTASMTTPENTSVTPTAAPKEAPSDPNIYGPGGVNFGTNPTQEQINQITGRTGKGIVPGGVDEYKRMLQAQGEFNDRERTQQEIAFRNYGTTFPGTQPAGRFADAYTPEELATRRYVADAELTADQGRNEALTQVAQAKQQAAQEALASQGFNSYEMKAIRDATDPDEKVNKMGKAFIQQNFDDKTLERLLKIYPDLFSGFGVLNAQQ